jgi:hypothetical protein
MRWYFEKGLKQIRAGARRLFRFAEKLGDIFSVGRLPVYRVRANVIQEQRGKSSERQFENHFVVRRGRCVNRSRLNPRPKGAPRILDASPFEALADFDRR